MARKLFLIGLALLAVSLCSKSFSVVLSFMNSKEPEAWKLELPTFAGRVLPPEKVETDTFSIDVDSFEEIKSWGKDGILTWRVTNRKITLIAYRPDSQTLGAWQKATKTIPEPSNWSFLYKTGWAQKSDTEGKLIVKPTQSDGFMLIILTAFLGSVICGFISFFWIENRTRRWFKS